MRRILTPTAELPKTIPPVTALPDLSVAGAIERRRSLRDYGGRPMTTAELSWLLHAATGMIGPGPPRALGPSTAGSDEPRVTHAEDRASSPGSSAAA